MHNPKAFFRPLALGAPTPISAIPATPSRMIHFFDPSNERMVSRLPELASRCDIVLGNLEDAIAIERKEDARRGLIDVANSVDLGTTPLWARANALDSPWVLSDLMEICSGAGQRIDVVMIPKVEAAADIHYLDRLLAQLEARHALDRPILVHAILETALGVTNVESIATASPRMQGMSFGPADLAASRRMKTTRPGGPHPDYRVLDDIDPKRPDEHRASAIQDPWHYSVARMVDACAGAEILPFYGPFGDIGDPAGCESQFRAANLLGCVGAWTLHPSQIEIARRVFTPSLEEIAFARRVMEAIPDGRGVQMIDGKMQDDATWKQCQVLVELAELLAERDRTVPEAEPSAAGGRQ